MNKVRMRAGISALACSLLVACSNAPGKVVNLGEIAKGVAAGKGKRQTPSPEQVAAMTKAALAATDAELLLVGITRRDVVSVMQQIETNGPYTTFGTSDRRSMTLRKGMLTATRGLGNDLMSADVSQVSELITGRKSGKAQRVQRYLDGENIIVALEATCTITPGETTRYQTGELDRTVVIVTEVCRSQQTAFDNSYHVDAHTGRILQSTQWIGPLNGYAIIQHLR